ncbi:uncharacterized protein PSANT_06166 [Moesziomyces antarcticus]|uniref:Uncharacterized protein n=1 Tax=Pseudozyma antarctica TaxID=84753 RepID=A0A5C3FXG9_PSEA2|nr:uncharacterized protein PSANT_06166 [Moesziomyces antarcticus]
MKARGHRLVTSLCVVRTTARSSWENWPRCSLPFRTDFISAFASDAHSALADVYGQFPRRIRSSLQLSMLPWSPSVSNPNADGGMSPRDEHSRGSNGMFRPEWHHSLCCYAAMTPDHPTAERQTYASL